MRIPDGREGIPKGLNNEMAHVAAVKYDLVKVLKKYFWTISLTDIIGYHACSL